MKEQNSTLCADAVGVVDSAEGTTVHCEALKGLPWLHLHVSSPSTPKGNTKLTVMEQSRHRGCDIKAVVFRNSQSRM